jgi:large subunit ribosomal protein L29
MPGPRRLQDAIPLPHGRAAAEYRLKRETDENIELVRAGPEAFLFSALGETVMKSSEYRQMTDEQIGLALRDVVKNLFHLRFQSATERLETPSEIRKAKREVARIRTIQRERQLATARTAAGTVTSPAQGV